ncbi:MAG TPA: glycosyltransferase [Candidatus Dormibacteraeota bacterium]
MILQAVIVFSLALAATTVLALTPRMMSARAWASLLPLAAVLALAGWGAAVLLNDVDAARDDTIVVGVVAVLVRLLMRRWSWAGSQLFATVVLSSLAYIVYAAVLTFAAGLSFGAIAASTVLLLLEIAALSLSVSYAFEIVDVLSRRDPPLKRFVSRTNPWVALQVATYNEPVEIVQRTLESLARIDYEHLLVQVVDNNTKDPALWMPLQQLCEQLGPRFQFMHLEPWPGFKAGALNEATRRLAPQVEIIGIVDADYIIQPDFLRAMVGHFDDASVAFAQSSQNYREWGDSRYLRGLFYSFRYFFDVTMLSRAHRNAIIFAGTMGLIRRSALEEIGGWSEWIITEDAEASLRMLGLGYRGVYDRRAYGAGLMPLDFDGLKKQRFRWSLGGVQILRRWWRELLPFGRHELHLSWGQRIHYLLGSVQWFGDPITAAFTFLLLLTALVTAMHHRLPLRQLTGGVLVVPLAFAVTGVARALWALRRSTRCTWGEAVMALRVWFALSWVVTLACVRGLIHSRADFLRTPKQRGGATLMHAVRSSRMESLIAVAAVAGAVAMILRSPSIATFFLGGLLLFEGAVYAAAPAASVAAEGIRMTPERREWMESPQNTGDRPSRRRNVLFGGAAAVAAAATAAAVAALVLNSPPDNQPFSSPNVPTIANPTSTPASSSTPMSTATPSPPASPSAAPSTTPSPSATPQPSSTPAAASAPPVGPAP